MKRLGDAHFIAVSVAAHAVLAVAVLVLHPPHASSRRNAIVVEMRRRPPPPPAALVEPPPAPPLLPLPPPPARRHASSADEPPPSPPPPPSLAPPPPPPVSPPAPVARPDLFAELALERVVSATGTIGVLAAAGGTTRSTERGDRDPNARDALADREHAKGVLNEMIGDHRLRDEVKKGKVAPRWRQAERAMFDSFRPTAETISDESTASSLFKGWANTRPQGGTTPRGVDDSQGGSGFLGGGSAGSQMSEIPEDLKRRTEVEVEVAPDGTIVKARVKRHSGRPQFDSQALKLVVSQLDHGGPLEDQKGVLMVWAVDAWVVVAPPSPVGGITFDEVSGKVSASHPLKKNVGKHVSLLSVRSLQ